MSVCITSSHNHDNREILHYSTDKYGQYIIITEHIIMILYMQQDHTITDPINGIFGFSVSPELKKILLIEKCIIVFETLCIRPNKINVMFPVTCRKKLG